MQCVGWNGKGGLRVALFVCAEMVVRAFSSALRQAQDEGKGGGTYGGLKGSGHVL